MYKTIESSGKEDESEVREDTRNSKDIFVNGKKRKGRKKEE